MKISDFLNTHAHRIWTGKHLKESQAKINLLLSHSDNANKNLEDLRAPDIIEFDHWLQEERGLCLRTPVITTRRPSVPSTGMRWTMRPSHLTRSHG